MMPTRPVPHRVLNVEELCALLHICPTTVYRLIKRGRLPAFRMGSDWRFNLEQIERRFPGVPRQ